MAALAQTPTSSDVRQAIVRYLIEKVGRPSISISEVSDAERRMLPPFAGATAKLIDQALVRDAVPRETPS
ncbi:hypothetical protein X727_24010 [Mesorhizobium sp. L103C119B0]|uniref:hypothetical protein n=1 Tax=Mesorhizobium sp. L103C119B0 TaxID=1287085 RepID=UPI0003CFCF4E|nr:hypothetical protein [Mesorhizobium sp. L103C119B0]ESZ67717.1 hypothetical protein X727_24010 [Mesorhizobium sp. L103C119B0]